MRRAAIPMVLAPALLAGCAPHHVATTSGTLAELHDKSPDLKEAKIDEGLDQAMQGYRRFLEDTPQTAMTPEAMRRLADLEIEKRFGIHTGDGKPQGMASPKPAEAPPVVPQRSTDGAVAGSGEVPRESDQDFERRTTAGYGIPADGGVGALPADAPGAATAPSGPLEAIALYDKLLTEYPGYEHNDQVLYQKARAYAELGRTEEAMATMDRLIQANPHSEHYDEVQFRRGEYFFTRRRYRDAEDAYTAILGLGDKDEYFELALYKLGWALYKQQLYEDALRRYTALLDHKVSIGYDFDETHEEEDERRVADTFRVISLSFNNLGGPEAVRDYFSKFGHRTYEDRVYANLGEYYLAKLRYDDAAKTYKTFVALYPFHRNAPKFSMRVIETFTRGGFPKLVVEAKREFAATYGLHADYWKHFEPEASPEVLAYLKANLTDLATHYHAQYQSAQDTDEKTADYREACRWYGEFLDSFPKDATSPAINYRLADLLFENRDFAEAAKQYERTAYDYAPHDQAAAAGYAAVYAHREQLKAAGDENRDAVKRSTVASSIKFADAFPGDERAPAILGAAADDLYELKDYPAAITTAQRVIDSYSGTDVAVRRSAWIVVAHGSFELADYPQAERAYTEVLAVTPEEDESRTALVDDLAASIYKQGELARDAKDYRSAADDFLRIRKVAPTSAICATAEYDAGAALMALESWQEAAGVLEAFRSAHPDHKLAVEATRLIANAYRKLDDSSRAAGEYDRLASESEDPKVRGEALLEAGDLYGKSDARDRALDAYQRYVDAFPQPVETALETRFKIAEIYKAAQDQTSYHQELADIVRIDAQAGPQRTDRTRTLAARSALVLAEQVFQDFTAVKLRQPFETSLQEKKRRMDAAIEAMDGLVAYEIADVTAAATYYMAETYLDFSRSLADSERPTDLQPADLQQYEQALEEEAFPFEEKAIAVHEKNLEMLHAGVFDDWTEKSLAKLAELVPGRYAKKEMDSGYPDAVDGYAYRSPSAPIYGPTSSDAGTMASEEPVPAARPAPAVAKGAAVEHADPR